MTPGGVPGPDPSLTVCEQGEATFALVKAFVLGLLAIGFAMPPAASATGGYPVLHLSRTSGPAGTRVVVVAQHCSEPFAQADTLAFHDAYYWLHDREKKPPMGVWRSIPVTRTSATTVRAVFTVRRTDHLGRGLLDLLCGTGGNATAIFRVTER